MAQTYVTRKGCNVICILMRALGERCTFTEMNIKDLAMKKQKLRTDVFFYSYYCLPDITVGIGYGDRE